MAFRAHIPARKLEDLPCFVPGPISPALQLLTGHHLPSPDSASQELSVKQTLLDGRLDVRTGSQLLSRRYRFLGSLGEGSSAQVILAEDLLSPQHKLVAIKIMKRQCTQLGLQEVRALRYLQYTGGGSGFVQLLGSFMEAGHLCIVLQRLTPSLLDCIALAAESDAAQRLHMLRHIACQLLAAVAGMHARGIVHCDLKPDNILLLPEQGNMQNGSPEVRIADLGSCFSVTGTDTKRIGFEAQTLPYRAPEVGLRQECAAPMDMWALGCILAELALQRPLFPAQSTDALLGQMKAVLGDIPDSLLAALLPGEGNHAASPAKPMQLIHRSAATGIIPSKEGMVSWQESLSPLHKDLLQAPGVTAEAASLIISMLQYDPKIRITAAKALLHPFLAPLLPLQQLTTPGFETFHTDKRSPTALQPAAAPDAMTALPCLSAPEEGVSRQHGAVSSSQRGHVAVDGIAKASHITDSDVSAGMRVQPVKPSVLRASLSTGGIAHGLLQCIPPAEESTARAAGQASSLNITTSSQPGRQAPAHATQSEASAPAPPVKQNILPQQTPLPPDRPLLSAALLAQSSAQQGGEEAAGAHATHATVQLQTESAEDSGRRAAPKLAHDAELQCTPARHSAQGAWSAIGRMVSQVSPPEQAQAIADHAATAEQPILQDAGVTPNNPEQPEEQSCSHLSANGQRPSEPALSQHGEQMHQQQHTDNQQSEHASQRQQTMLSSSTSAVTGQPATHAPTPAAPAHNQEHEQKLQMLSCTQQQDQSESQPMVHQPGPATHSGRTTTRQRSAAKHAAATVHGLVPSGPSVSTPGAVAAAYSGPFAFLPTPQAKCPATADDHCHDESLGEGAASQRQLEQQSRMHTVKAADLPVPFISRTIQTGAGAGPQSPKNAFHPDGLSQHAQPGQVADLQQQAAGTPAKQSARPSPPDPAHHHAGAGQSAHHATLPVSPGQAADRAAADALASLSTLPPSQAARVGSIASTAVHASRQGRKRSSGNSSHMSGHIPAGQIPKKPRTAKTAMAQSEPPPRKQSDSTPSASIPLRKRTRSQPSAKPSPDSKAGAAISEPMGRASAEEASHVTAAGSHPPAQPPPSEKRPRTKKKSAQKSAAHSPEQKTPYHRLPAQSPTSQHVPGQANSAPQAASQAAPQAAVGHASISPGVKCSIAVFRRAEAPNVSEAQLNTAFKGRKRKSSSHRDTHSSAPHDTEPTAHDKAHAGASDDGDKHSLEHPQKARHPSNATDTVQRNAQNAKQSKKGGKCAPQDASPTQPAPAQRRQAQARTAKPAEAEAQAHASPRLTKAPQALPPTRGRKTPAKTAAGTPHAKRTAFDKASPVRPRQDHSTSAALKAKADRGGCEQDDKQQIGSHAEQSPGRRQGRQREKAGKPWWVAVAYDG